MTGVSAARRLRDRARGLRGRSPARQLRVPARGAASPTRCRRRRRCDALLARDPLRAERAARPLMAAPDTRSGHRAGPRAARRACPARTCGRWRDARCSTTRPRRPASRASSTASCSRPTRRRLPRRAAAPGSRCRSCVPPTLARRRHADAAGHPARARRRWPRDGWTPDIIVLLQPTSPLRRPAHVREAVELLRESGADSVVTVVELPRHLSPDYVMRIEDGVLRPFLPEGARVTRRQDARPAYSRDGTVYACRRDDARPVRQHLRRRTAGRWSSTPGESLSIDYARRLGRGRARCWLETLSE